MKRTLLGYLVISGLICSAASAGTAAEPEKSQPAPAGSTVPAKPVIRMGMTPEAVAKVIGQPLKIEPVKTPAGEGFRWVYRRLTKEWADQVAVDVTMVPSFVGLAMANQGVGNAAMPANQLARFRQYQVSSLLFVGGKLVGSTQWPETEKSFQQ